MRVNGLFGWVRHNDVRSIVLLFGFILIVQLLACLALSVPLLWADLMHSPFYYWSGYCSRYVPIVAIGSAALFAFRMWRHVKAVNRETAFRYVDGKSEPRLTKTVDVLAIAVGIVTPQVAIIDSPAMNAFACGVSQNSAVVVVTRGLLDGLDDDQLAGVIAHELIHVRNGDIRLMAAANIFMSSLVVLNRLSFVRIRSYGQIFIVFMKPVLLPLFVGLGLVGQLCMRLGYASRLMLASSREFIADAGAIQITQNPAAFVSALTLIDGKSNVAGLSPQQDAMMIDGATMGALATHPTIAERIGVIAGMVGSLALDRRAPRDTRAVETRVGPWNPADPTESSGDRDIERAALSMSARPALNRSTLLRVGADGNIGLFGIRWDLGVALVATLCASFMTYNGDLSGYLAKMVAFYGRPTANETWFVERASRCGAAPLGWIFGVHNESACGMTPEFLARAKNAGHNILPDGRTLSNGELALLSPAEIERSQHSSQSFKTSILEGKSPAKPPVILAYSNPDTLVPLPLPEIYRRLVAGNLQRYLNYAQCGMLVHAHVGGEIGKEVKWRITSEGKDLVRFTMHLSASGTAATRAMLTVDDLQQLTDVYQGDAPGRPPEKANLHPALTPPLRRAFTEAVTAMIEQRPFDGDRVQRGVSNADSTTDAMCDQQHDRLATGSSPSEIAAGLKQ